MLELDELWSFVYRKSEKVWVWGSPCAGRDSPGGGLLVMGDRSRRATCEHLWRAIPESYEEASCYSDFWEAYQSR